MIRISRRTVRNLLLAMGALALGIVAQGYFAHPTEPFAPKPTDGLLVYAVVVLLFVIAIARSASRPRLSFAVQPYEHIHLKLPARLGRLLFFMVLFVLAGVAMVVSLVLFGDDAPGSLKWGLYLAAVVLYLAAAYTLTPPERRQWWPDLKSYEWLVLAGILLIALFFRLYRFHDLPYGMWYDEADNGLWARRLLEDPTFRPVYAPSTNLPSHFLYLIVFSFRLFGDSMHAIRVVAVVFGMLTVVAAYFCGREMFGWQGQGRAMGLVLAFLLAVSRWDVNWSRIGMHGVTVPFFELWTMAALLRGLRTGRATAFAWAGVATGLGLCFYSPMRVFPFIVGGFLLVLFVRWMGQMVRRQPTWSLRERVRRTLSTWGLLALVFLAGLLLAVGPVAQFALHYPELFWDRATKISVFNEASAQGHPIKAVVDNTIRHLLMLNYRGDPNGRHNLPGRPMLDRLGSVLFVLGVVLCLGRLSDARSILLLLWLLIPLSGGILSVSFEAPQSLRSIGALPAAYLLICLPMLWFAAEWKRVFGHASPRYWLVAAVAVLACIGLYEGMNYFYFWARDFAAWGAFNPAETHMAQDINRYRDRYELQFDPLLTAHLTTRYLAPDFELYRHFDPATVFPITSTSQEGVLLFIAPDTRALREQAQVLYPAVRVETFVHPGSDRAVLYKYFFDRDVISAAQGLDVSLISLQSSTEVEYQIDAEVNAEWGADPPVSYPFTVSWSGGVLAPRYGAYTVRVDAPGEVILVLDGQTVFGGDGTQSREILLAHGVHALYLECRLDGPGAVRLEWKPPWSQTTDAPPSLVPGEVLYRSTWPVNGLVGRFYANADWSGEPQNVRIDRQLRHYFHFLPLPRPYTVEWKGRLWVAEAGVYKLGVRAVSSAWLEVDGMPVVEDTPAGVYQEGQVNLETGMHDLAVRFLDDQDRSQIYLYWSKPDMQEIEPIPFEVLFLPREGAWWDVR